jgi:hypothetical protein
MKAQAKKIETDPTRQNLRAGTTSEAQIHLRHLTFQSSGQWRSHVECRGAHAPLTVGNPPLKIRDEQ